MTPKFAAAAAEIHSKMGPIGLTMGLGRPALFRTVATVALLGALTGCAGSLPSVAANKAENGNSIVTGAAEETSNDDSPSVNPSGSVDSKRIAEEGLKYLRNGDSEKAVRLFNAAIKFDSKNPTYHLLAGIAYHLEFRKTSAPEMRDNAEIGYKLSAQFDPSDARAPVQLGRLFLDAKRFRDARDAFATALEANPANSDALHGMATSSYLLGDIKVALWAVSELETQKYDPTAIARMRAVFYAAIGDKERSSQYSAAYAASAVQQSDVGSFDERLSQINAMVAQGEWLKNSADVSSSQSPDASAPSAAEPIADAPTSETEVAADAPTQAEPWWVCPGRQNDMQAGMSSDPQGGSGGDETVQLRALPAPCAESKPPKMAIIDVVMLRTEDSVSRSYGSNLLQNLTGYFGMSANLNGSTSSGGNLIGSGTTTTTLGIAGQLGLGSALAYSLNIANATQNRNEVLARPTLLAIDRLPSTFFSGSNISISVGGGFPGAQSSLVDKQVGVSFSVTPTFIDDDQVLLSVRTARSFVTAPAVGTNGVALSQSRLSTSANLVVRPGQTVILSGLAERERVRGKSGVPVLRDIPGIQYLFSSDQNVDFFRTVMVMLTLRKPVTTAEDVAGVEAEKQAREKTGVPQIKKYGFYWRVDEYAKVLSRSAPNMDAAIDALFSNKLYQTFKSRDLDDKDWASQSKMQMITKDFQGLFIR